MWEPPWTCWLGADHFKKPKQKHQWTFGTGQRPRSSESQCENSNGVCNVRTEPTRADCSCLVFVGRYDIASVSSGSSSFQCLITASSLQGTSKTGKKGDELSGNSLHLQHVQITMKHKHNKKSELKVQNLAKTDQKSPQTC